MLAFHAGISSPFQSPALRLRHTATALHGRHVNRLYSPLEGSTINASPESSLSRISSPWQIFKRTIQLSIIFFPCIALYPLWRLHSVFYRRSNEPNLWWISLLVSSLERAGPVFIKLGQWISSRNDLFSFEICSKFSRLQAQARPHSWMSSSHRIQELLRATNHGNETRMELVDIHQIPCGVGAMAQVHEGTLIDHSKGTKERVAIKVLHPAVEERMATDLNFIKAFESFVSALVPGANHLNLKEEIVSFTEMMARQGSLRVEAANLKRFQGNFKDSSDLSIAFPSPRLFNEHVLVETFHTGISLQKLIQLKNSPFNEQVSKLGVKSLSKMVLKDNFCHADMHPGNVFITLHRKAPDSGSWLSSTKKVSELPLDDASYSRFAHASERDQRELLETWHEQGYTPGLLLLDAGLVSHLSPPQFSSLVQIFEAGLSFDGERVADLIIAESRFPTQILNPNGVRQELQTLLKAIELDGNGMLMLSKLSASQIVNRFADVVRTHHIGMHGEYVGLFLSCVTVEGIGKSLGADFDLLPVISF